MIHLPNIETERLLLRPIKRSDAKAIFDYAWRDDVGPRAGWAPHQSLKDTKQYIEYALNKPSKNQPGVFVVVLKTENRVIGTMEIHSMVDYYKAAIGMVCHPLYQNQGYMYEASMATIIYGFEHLKLKRLSYSHFPSNLASQRLREKLGFIYEGVLRQYHRRFDGLLFDFVMSSLTADDYIERYDDVFKPFKDTITMK